MTSLSGKRWRRRGLGVVLMLAATPWSAAQGVEGYEARIDITRNGSSVELVPLARSAREESIAFTFKVVRKGASGSARIHQSGTAGIGPDRWQRLGSARINAERGDHCEILLELYTGGVVVARQKASCPP